MMIGLTNGYLVMNRSKSFYFTLYFDSNDFKKDLHLFVYKFISNEYTLDGLLWEYLPIESVCISFKNDDNFFTVDGGRTWLQAD